MRPFYKENTANYPRLFTDVFFADYGNEYSFKGFIDQAIRYIENFQLLDSGLWERFVSQFRWDSDYDAGWRGEFWGKMMRGACFTYSYTKTQTLYEILKKTVCDMMASADQAGRITTYGLNHEFDGWDIWTRKYVLLGMQYFIEICTDEAFNQTVIASMKRQADYIISKIGSKEEGKIPINAATRHWRGLNSSSLLEPIVRLYSLTKECRYLDFATYIVNEGGMDVANVFELAYENKLYPYQYPATKAYEMMSCFEGLLEYYRITGEEKYKKSIINFADKILDHDFTIIGCCGCTHELFDHSTVRQTNTNNGFIQQETCVTVTLMKFLYQLTLLTGDAKYSDAFETSLYNAFLGSINTEKAIDSTIRQIYPEAVFEPMPFDSYSPLTAGTRGLRIGGLQLMSDKHYYGCCACIGAAGNGLISKMALLTTKKGLNLNLYIDGEIRTATPGGNKISFVTQTGYPRDGGVKITLHMEEGEHFELLLRNPGWSKKTEISVNGEKVPEGHGYISVSRNWEDGDTITLQFDMRTAAIYPIPYGSQVLMNEVVEGYNYVIPKFDEEDPIAKNHIALRRGPIILAQENRLGYSVDTPVSIEVDKDGYVDVEIPVKDTAPYSHIVEARVPLKGGERMNVTDYASAGKLWTEESKMAAWMLTEG